MTSLAQRCERQLPRVARARGKDYFVSGRVSDPSIAGEAFALSVRGSGVTYRVLLDYSKVPTARTLEAHCDCPYYEGGGLCKHLWASILQIDKSGFSRMVPESGPLRVLHAKGGRPGRGQPLNGHGNGHGQHAHGQRPMPMPRQLPAPLQAPGATRTQGALGWRERLDRIQGLSGRRATFAGNAEAFFVINAAETVSHGKLVIDLWMRDRQVSGDLGPLKPSRVSRNDVVRFAEIRDQEILTVLLRTCDPQSFAPFGQGSGLFSSRFTVDPILETHLIPTLTAAGKLFLSRSPNGTPDDADRPLRMDRGEPWELELKIEPVAGSEEYALDGVLKRGEETRRLDSPICVFRSGFLLFADRVGQLADPRQAAWASDLRSEALGIPKDQGDTLIRRILTDPNAPPTTWPEDMGWKVLTIEPRPRGVFRALGNDPATGRMTVTVTFDYDGREVSLDDTSRTLVNIDQKRVYQRNLNFEEDTLGQAREILRDESGTGTFPAGDLHRVATELSQAGWEVFIEGQRLRVADDFAMNVSTSTDWFELKAQATFGNNAAGQPELLAALERKQNLVQLADGSVGMLPQEWIDRYAALGKFGEKTGEGGLRFNKSQGLLLDAALGDEEHLKADKGFRSYRDKIRDFEGVKTIRTPKGFKGKLRNYQKEGLNWLDFVEAFGMGGILADDMGLGKTIQVLAFLQGRKGKGGKPAIVVAPKSLVFNWMDEAARFVPDLKVVGYSGAGRTKLFKELSEADLVVTTYGTLRTDVEKLQEVQFDVAIVDEAQAIKNAESQSAQACKKIKATHRLALTGTPIENSLTDLFSILEFTSPGLLSFAAQKDMSQDTRAMLSRMLKPFVLRRTKEKVLQELPEKSEQVLYCEMSVREKELYTSLRDHYRASLTAEIEKNGLNKSKIHVLEALLRLRQASCHPGLVNPDHQVEPSAKLELMLNQVREVIQEGHKALVFSQFTSLLALVKPLFDQEGIAYEYLDGQTVDRKAPVERFQTDPKVPVFLISLKAGGTGLNLTAADYVFLLDPWWNPAVEAQAIGRAHRIGQSNKVFAYRMIARGTVEEKILDLQKSKRELAESIIAEDDKDFLRKLTKEDLAALLA